MLELVTSPPLSPDTTDTDEKVGGVSVDLDRLIEGEPLVKDLVDFLEGLEVGIDISTIEAFAYEKIKKVMESPDECESLALKKIDRILSVCRRLRSLSEALREDLRFMTSGDNSQVEVMEMLLQDFFRFFKEWQRKYPQPVGHVEDSAAFLRGLSSSLLTMTNQLNQKSIPWISGTEVSHMTSVYQLSSLLGEIAGLFYHQTNAAREGGPATTEFEEGVVKSIGVMIGYGENAYGYLTHGGTHANKSALIAARKVFFRPLLCKMVVELLEQKMNVLVDIPVGIDPTKRKMLSQLSETEILKLSPDEKIGINQALWDEAVRLGVEGDLQQLQAEMEEKLPEIHARLLDKIMFVVPEGINHHSIRTTIESLGFGAGNIREVPLQGDSFHVDYQALEENLRNLNDDGKIIVGYLDVIGSTGFGSMTSTKKLLEIRQACEKLNFSFNIHIDGAYGGPLISIFRKADGGLISLEQAKSQYCTSEYALSEELVESLYETFSHLSGVDSVTVDLHKLMYGVYSGGGGSIVWKNSAVKDIISKYPPYYGDRENGEPYAFSRLDGCTFPGSAATAAHLSIENVGLDQHGIGKYQAEAIKSCEEIFQRLSGIILLDAKGDAYELRVLNRPQIHIFNFIICPRDQKVPEKESVNRMSQAVAGFMRNNSEAGRSFGLSLNEVDGYKYVRVTAMNPFALQGGLLEEFVDKLRAYMVTDSSM
jgi:glutamate/tyrosine decarboxylase-like PLP-dependent enzyme